MTMISGSDVAAGSPRGRRSVIDADSRFSGTYTTPNDLQIDGQYEGTIDCVGLVLVTESADVNAHVTAGSVSVTGRLRGEVGCRGRFEILPSGQVDAKVEAAVIVVHDGARFDGEMRMRPPGAAERPDEPATVSTDLRPPRRTGSAEAGAIPRFHAETPRTNGRNVPAESQPPPDLDISSPHGHAVDPATKD